MKDKLNKLCILGSAPSKKDAPYKDASYDIWAISGAAFSESLYGEIKENTESNSWNDVHRVDLLFEMHKRPLFASKIEQLNKCKKQVMMQELEKDIPLSKKYPCEEVIEIYGNEFSSTIAYMLAYALFLGYKHIELYGVVMMHKTEYVRQRAGIKFYLGIAKALGIYVWAPEDTQLTKTLYRYGYEDHDTLCTKILDRKAIIVDDIDKQNKIIDAAQATLWQLKGALITCDNLIDDIKGGLA